MKDLLPRFQELEREISREKGPFWLFALFLRENAVNRLWDVVVSAPWTEGHWGDTLEFMASRLQETLRPEDMVRVSRIVVIERGNPGLDEITQEFNVEHGAVEVRDETFFGLEIKRGYILASNPPSVEAAVPVG